MDRFRVGLPVDYLPGYLTGVVEALPLPVFLICTGLIQPGASQDWLVPYLAATLTALATTLWLLSRQVTLNRLFIGINAYLLSGAIGLLTHQTWLNNLYGHLQAAGMLGWIVLVGALTTALSPVGFVGIRARTRRSTFIYSLLLLAVALAAFLTSYYFRGSKIFSELVPFIALFAAHSRLKSKLTPA